RCATRGRCSRRKPGSRWPTAWCTSGPTASSLRSRSHSGRDAHSSCSREPRDAVCVLTHDAKFDVPAILGALATDVGYVGAMGSRRTHATRVARLREEGIDEAALARVMAPIGLDIGGRTPEETAIAICA